MLHNKVFKSNASSKQIVELTIFNAKIVNVFKNVIQEKVWKIFSFLVFSNVAIEFIVTSVIWSRFDCWDTCVSVWCLMSVFNLCGFLPK